MNTHLGNRFSRVALVLALGVGAAALSAQGGGGGRPPGGGGGGFGGGGGMGAASFTRLGMLTSTLKLDDPQKKQAKTILDDAYKAAATLRTSLAAARQKLGAAVQAGDQAQIDAAATAYAEQATSMAKAEAQAIAKIVGGLKPEQTPAAAVQIAVSYMRGAFIGKKWDAAPDVRFY